MRPALRSSCGLLSKRGIRVKVSLAVVAALSIVLSGNEAHGYELKKSSTGKTVRWTEDTITLRLSESFHERFGVEESWAAANGAAEAWAGIPGVPSIRIVRGNVPAFNERELSNSIHLLKRAGHGLDDLALTYTQSTPDGYVVAADIVVNGHQPLCARGAKSDSFGGPERFDLQAVLTHEMGHLLGLDENELDEEATMHPDIGPGETFQCSISDDDRAGAMAVYEDELPRYDGCTIAYQRHSSSPFLLLLLIGAIGKTRARQRRQD